MLKKFFVHIYLLSILQNPLFGVTNGLLELKPSDDAALSGPINVLHLANALRG